MGGAGCAADIVYAVDAGADAVARASVLPYNKTTVPQLKAELRLGIRQWIDDNGPPGYEAKLRHRVRTRKMRDGEPKKTNRNK